MNCLVHAIVLVSLAATLVFPSSASAVGKRFFIGLWEGIDIEDGSALLLSISDTDGDGILEVRATDTFFSNCIAQNKGFSGSPAQC